MSTPRQPYVAIGSLAPFPAGPEPVARRSRSGWSTGLVALAWTTALGTALGALAGGLFGLVLLSPALVVLGLAVGAATGLTAGVAVGAVVASVVGLVRMTSHHGPVG